MVGRPGRLPTPVYLPVTRPCLADCSDHVLQGGATEGFMIYLKLASRLSAMVALCGQMAFAQPLQVPADAIAIPQVVNASTPGTTEGVFAVGGDGSAHYAIPLWVSPGRAGIQPSLTLNYDSHAGAGSLGQGWAIDGI